MNSRLASPLQRGVRSDELTNEQPLNRMMAREILNYFMRNPQAADTLEGVARWRLMDEVIRRKLDETEAVLESLVTHGYLTRSMSPGGIAMFSLNSERAGEARQFLATLAAGPGEAEQ